MFLTIYHRGMFPLANILFSGLLMSLKIWPQTFYFNEKWEGCRWFVMQDLEKKIMVMSSIKIIMAKVCGSTIQKFGISKYSRENPWHK